MEENEDKPKNKYNTRYADLTPEQIDNLTLKECLDLINEKQRIFAISYITHFSPKRAAIEAGYSEHSAAISGAKNKKHPIIQRYIELLNKSRMERLEIDSDKVIEEFAKIGFFNIKDIFGEDGNILKVSEMPENVSAGISKIKEKILKKGETATIMEREYSFHNKVDALRDLGKHLGIFEKDNKQKLVETHLYLPDNNRSKPAEKQVIENPKKDGKKKNK